VLRPIGRKKFSVKRNADKPQPKGNRWKNFLLLKQRFHFIETEEMK
jgi:hypothetical protein